MRLLRRFTKRGQTGQSIVILAIGFLALLGFVGIVTDISVLFIRYSTMRRAIDAAAIAAASQMRRVADEDGDVLTAEGEAMSVANLNLAARQFIEVYGLNPKSVIVETCRAQQVGRDSNGLPQDAGGEYLFRVGGSGAPMLFPEDEGDYNAAANLATLENYLELCTDDQLKLVRVTAQIDAPTIFLRLLGYPTVTLTESAISQTAVIDVVLIFDVSESMLNETTYEAWDTLSPPQGVRYIPTFVDYGRRENNEPIMEFVDTDGDGVEEWIETGAFYPMPPWQMLVQSTQDELDLWMGVEAPLAAPDVYYSNDLITNPDAQPVRLGDMTLRYETGSTLGLGSRGLQEYTGQSNSPLLPVGRVEPRQFCRVRVYPNSSSARVSIPSDLRQDYYDFLQYVYNDGFSTDSDPTTYDPIYSGAQAFNDVGLALDPQVFHNVVPKVFIPSNPNLNDPVPAAYYQGFVPMYDYYGCCNDPNGDFDFADLICQPFKEARDAAEGFLARLDFLRGDRVGFVTFNRQAYLVDPDGDGPQNFMIETETDFCADGTPSASCTPNTDTTTGGNASNRHGATETLRSLIGVMAEESYYADNGNDGDWDGLVERSVDCGATPTLCTMVGENCDVIPNNCIEVGFRTYDAFGDVRVGDIINHPVKNACTFDKAVLDPMYFTPEDRALPPDGLTLRPSGDYLIREVYTLPSWYQTNGIPTASVAANAQDTIRNYEYTASCAGTNIGGALGGGSLMLWEEGRREGAVWIMVLLSDGAAGASNPIYNIQNPNPTPPNNVDGVRPFFRDGAYLDPQPGSGPAGIPAGYGYFGLCPYGTETALGNAGTNGTLATMPQLLLSNSFPTCSDLRPDIRHFCGDSAAPPSSGSAPFSPLDNDNFAAANRCVDFYDVDDYARDWADWVSVAELPGAVSGGTTGRVSDQLLPTIFTIGFGLNFGDGTTASCDTYTDAAQNAACLRGDAAYPATGDSAALRRERNADYLGEELLRYIADVGDNFQIDSDFWQLCASQTVSSAEKPVAQTATCLLPGFQNAVDRIGNDAYLNLNPPDWGVRGPCEQDYSGLPASRGNVYAPLPPTEACGNYFNAPSGNELQEVFNQIASRMFTRLSQ